MRYSFTGTGRFRLNAKWLFVMLVLVLISLPNVDPFKCTQRLIHGLRSTFQGILMYRADVRRKWGRDTASLFLSSMIVMKTEQELRLKY